MTAFVGDVPSPHAAYAFRHQVPDEFVRLPDPTTSDGWRKAMGRLMPEADDEQREAAAARMRDYLPRLSRRGEETTILTAMCVGTENVEGDERLSMGLLAVSVRPSGHQDPLLAAEGIYQAKARRLLTDARDVEEVDYPLGKGLQGEQDLVLAVKLPSGPGVMSTSLRSLTLPATEGRPAPGVPMASLQLVIPAPRGYAVYVTIATPSVFLLDSYCLRLAHIGRSFDFDSPAGSGPVEAERPTNRAR
ncbi:hypothetical protein [Streptomyces sp. WMMC905]|uniref:hypothetical protein n=1 Tax=Streptomyces sp. WMMC905 TaxID=3404123 RepID=UPI003B92A66A